MCGGAGSLITDNPAGYVQMASTGTGRARRSCGGCWSRGGTRAGPGTSSSSWGTGWGSRPTPWPGYSRWHGACWSWAQTTSASKSSIRRLVITEKAPTRAFSWLKAATTAFTFKTLLRHYAKRALTQRSLNVKLGPQLNYHKGRAAIRHYANQPANQEKALVGAFSVIVKTDCETDWSFASLVWIFASKLQVSVNGGDGAVV